MKIRNGFVSNSSTASFVVFVDDKSLKKIIEQFTPNEIELIEAVLGNSVIKKIGKVQYNVFCGESGNETLHDIACEIIRGEDEDVEKDNDERWEKTDELCEAWEKFLECVDKCENCFTMEK